MSEARARVQKLVWAARRIADAGDPLGRRAREVLPASTGLSRENVELALSEILESHPSEAELAALVTSVEPAPRAHVLLASNVFVAAHRAIALALAQTRDVHVRASRREPEMAELLCEASEGAFELQASLAPAPGEHLWVYGSDETLVELRRGLTSGVVLHAHGAGFGVAVVEPHGESELEAAAHALASDVVPFDQRGCLSPRLALVVADDATAEHFAKHLARALEALERRIPTGRMTPDEAADVARWRDTMRFAGELLPAGSGFVSFGLGAERLAIPPVGRNVAVVATRSPDALLGPVSEAIAALGFAGSQGLAARIATLLPGARRSALGRMQRPAFDGPVDLRPAARDEVV